ncbi:Myb-like DNA-binding domain containing protein [Trichomonas vaginalis G3]|uniref:Myb-like DNA-binding domain containing protein n=1 Tax=Trichomonas vaginalis (strain ATCC PRA-98 / G3) TaxID=412133 RepID=A2EZH4_TRIV3|nr:RNA polymerase II transcription regulator recruiting protein [Trichomonas vaginalis G3]EAY01940.1 Myb-like DNA-binding domain containing protein [Trichomonas vaginalis G3]KAI5506267.1 RNA polymerase II transcription regulator recruiting protein [Trichomonas vaginalis G3]|eukprot:XP_001330455.1 Myb-like DNA-binding domain containing protein [Trichomonas vaginalis G3]
MAAANVTIPVTPKKNQRFTSEEDEILRSIVSQHSKLSWKEIAKNLPGRTASQCRDRYNQYLYTEVVAKPWTVDEDKLIIEKYMQYGPHWVQIAKFLPGRSGVNIKNRWNSALKKYHKIPHKNFKITRRLKSERSSVQPADISGMDFLNDLFRVSNQALMEFFGSYKE